MNIKLFVKYFDNLFLLDDSPFKEFFNVFSDFSSPVFNVFFGKNSLNAFIDRLHKFVSDKNHIL